LLARETAQLLAEAQQVALRLVGLTAHGVELALGALEILGEALLVLDQREREIVAAAADRAAHVALDAHHLDAPLVDLGLELVAHEQDPRDRLFQLAVLARAVLDRLLVDRGGIAPLAAAHPASKHRANEIRQAGHHDSFPQSSDLSPSSRIFCCRLWRTMPSC